MANPEESSISYTIKGLNEVSPRSQSNNPPLGRKKIIAIVVCEELFILSFRLSAHQGFFLFLSFFLSFWGRWGWGAVAAEECRRVHSQSMRVSGERKSNRSRKSEPFCWSCNFK